MKKFYFLFLFALIASIGNLYAAEKTVTYTFTSKTWEAAEGNWNSLKNGDSKEARGVAVTNAVSGASAESPSGFSKITSVNMVWSTSGKGVGTINMYISDNKVGSKTVGKSQSNQEFSVATDPSTTSGVVKFDVKCTKGTIYIKSISITYEEGVETKCATPTFTPAAGYLKLGNAITFTSATADAEVYYQYSYNGGEYNSFVKGTSFTPDKEGTYKVIAKATKTGLEDGVSEEQIYEVENLVFYESFDKNDGTGGNDGKWSGTIASNDIQYDVAGWTCTSASGANKCAKFGASGTKGKATTPALTGLVGDAVLTFKAGAWNVANEKTTLNISITNGTLDKASVDLKKGEFTEYTINITGADATSTITFEAAEDKNNRFFLDEVKVKQVAVATPTITPNGGDVNVGDKITFATKTDGATLSYSTDGGQTWTSGSEYTATKAGALNLWVKAKKDSDESAVAKATFNVVDPNAISVNINITADKTAATGELFGTMTVAVPMPINATVMDVVIKKDGKEFSSDKNLTTEFSKEITETGTYEIDVTANNDNEITGDTKTAKFYSNKLTDIADFLLYGPECNNLFGSDVVYEFTCPLSVTFSKGENLWVTDGTDGMLIFQRGGFSTAYTNGTVFAKGIKGQYTVFRNTIELLNPTLTETTEGATIDPKQIEIAAIKAENQNQFVIIKDAVLNVENKTFADAAGNTVDMYDKKFCTVPADGTYDVVGIVSYYGYSGAVPATQVYPLAFLTAPTATLGFTAAEINEMSWLAANDKVLTEEATEVKDASCVKLTCEEGTQIEYTLVSSETGTSTATVESGAEIVGLIKGEVYELTVCAVKGGYKSASRKYMFTITGSTSSVSSMSSEGVKVVAAEGGVEVVADEAADVAVYTVAGQLVRQARVAEGSTLVNVAPGFYVVRANGTATKVIVR